MAGATQTFLADTGLRAGWRCLDVGCGDGQVAIAMARAVGPDGRVTGLDVDAGALEIARGAAEAAGVTVDLVMGDAGSPPVREAFDLAYARLVLSHLADPAAALVAMQDAVRPGGVIAVEDLDTGTLRAEPPSAALDRLRDLYAATVLANGGDPAIGPRLPALLGAAGLRDVRERTVVNRMEAAEDKVFLVELIDNMRPAMLDAGVAPAAELDDVRRGVDRVARDPGAVIHQARIHQVQGRRPA